MNELAQTEFQKVLKQAPNNVPALASAGEIYLHDGQLEKAETMLSRAVKAGASAGRVRMEWVLALARLHRYKEAQSVLAGVAEPRTPEEKIEFHRLKASIASGLGNSSAAASEMEKALALHPQDRGLAMATAVAELQSRNWQRAASLIEPVYAQTHDLQAGLVLLEAQLGMQADYHKTLQSLSSTQLQPVEESALRQRLAEVLIAHDEFAAAVPELARAVELEPGHADVVYNLALAQFRTGRLDEALTSAEKARTLGDSAEIEDLLGDIEESRGDNLAAVKSYQAAAELAPNEEKYRLALAVEFMRHKSFDPARMVLKQAESLWPRSWRINLALGMVEYFAGSDAEASRILVHAAELAPSPETALQYLGNIELDMAGAPTPAAITRICAYSDRHSTDEKFQSLCGALLFKRDYGEQDKTHVADISRRLQLAANLKHDDPSPHCQLGKLYRWIEQWEPARAESEACVRLDPQSADGHYRLAQIYQHLGEVGQSEQEMKLYKAASQHMADENARRDETIKTFLYTIQGEQPDHK